MSATFMLVHPPLWIRVDGLTRQPKPCSNIQDSLDNVIVLGAQPDVTEQKRVMHRVD